MQGYAAVGGAGLFLFSKTITPLNSNRVRRMNVDRNTRTHRENIPDANGMEIIRT